MPGAAVAATAAPAAAATHVAEVVLVNPATVTVGHTFPVGVWYQSFSGGSRYYHVAVYEPRRAGGQLIFYRAGSARSSGWALWSITASKLGYYKIVYHTCTYPGHVWSRYVAYTVSVR